MLFARLSSRGVCLCIASLLFVATAANVSSGQIAIEPLDRGWYNEYGFHDPANPNFFVGDGRGPLGGVPVPYEDVRNFFVFDLTEATDPVATATLSLTVFENLGFSNGFVSQSLIPRERYQLVDVQSDPFDLITGCVGDPSFLHLPAANCRALGESIHEDLGAGTRFGEIELSTDDLGSQLMIPLNGLAVAELDQSRTTTQIFSLGGWITTLDEFANDEFAFAGTAESGVVAELILNTTVDADINDDSLFDCRDVDALVAGIASGDNDATLDLTGDGIVDGDDLSQWLATAGDANLPNGQVYLPGDANLDGFVDVSDFNVWNSHRFSTSIGWCAGDFNADGTINDADFALWTANRFAVAMQSSASVPEPQSAWTLLFAMSILLGVRRRANGR